MRAVAVKAEFQGGIYEVPYAYWGANNTRPQDIITEVNKSGIAKAGLSVRQMAHYGSGPF